MSARPEKEGQFHTTNNLAMGDKFGRAAVNPLGAGPSRTYLWRTVFQSIYQCTSSSSSSSSSEAGWPKTSVQLVQELLGQISLVRSAAELPLQEVAVDIHFLMQSVFSWWRLCKEPESLGTLSKVCNLMTTVSSHMHLEFRLLDLINLLQMLCEVLKWLNECYSLPKKNLQFYDSCCELHIEVLRALGQLFHDNGGQVPAEEVNPIVNILISLIISQSPQSVTPSSNVTARQMDGRREAQSDKECQRLAFLAIGNVFSRASALICKEVWNKLVLALRRILDDMVVGKTLSEDLLSSRFYAAVLRCTHLVLSDAKGPLEEHVASFVASLRVFFGYGLKGISGRRETSTHGKSGSNHAEFSDVKPKKDDLYRPPHLRSKASCSSDKIEVTMQSNVTCRHGFSSDSDLSDSDNYIGEQDHHRSSKARTNAILAIQAMAHANPKLVHAQWTLLFPTQDVLNPRPYQMTLLTVLLFDPVVKARMAAVLALTALLEGPLRSFLQLSEYKESTRSGSFTTISSSLGQVVLQLHEGLVYAITHESHAGTLQSAFKALSLLFAATPYDRLPPDVLANAIRSVHRRAHSAFVKPHDQISIMVAALDCLSASFCASPVSQQVACMIQENILGSHNSEHDKSLFLDLILYAKSCISPVICIGSLQVLKDAVHNYSTAVFCYWQELSFTVHKLISCERSNLIHGSGDWKGFEDKIISHAIRLLDEFLRAASGFKGTDDTADSLLQPPSPSLLPRPVKFLPVSKVQNNTDTLEIIENWSPSFSSGSSEWLEVINKHLPAILVHSSPTVRGAALTCFAGLTSAVFSSLPLSKRDFIVLSVTTAALKDGIPSVRSAACRAIGVLVGFLNLVERYHDTVTITKIIQSSIVDSSISVRITSSWALANMCDAISKASVKDHNYDVPVDNGILKILAECSILASKDGDKVRANAVRAIGNLAKFLNFGVAGDRAGMTGAEFVPSLWLEKMVQTLLSCISTGNVKVQWNVCHSLGNLFMNRSLCLKAMLWLPSIFSILLVLVRDSSNYKIRIHSAAALAIPTEREDYGDSFGDVVQGLVHSLEACDVDQGIGPSIFKYKSLLLEQLTFTSLHVIGLATSEDFTIMRDFLSKRSSSLYNFLESSYRAATRECSESIHDKLSRPGTHDDAPKECLWPDGKNTLAQRLDAIKKASNGLAKMYSYGHNETCSSKFQALMAKFENIHL